MRILVRDMIAMGILVALFVCKLLGMDGVIDSMIALVIGYYFSKRVYEETNGRTNKRSS